MKRLFQFLLNTTHILDWPRFPHRGFMVDTSRHFLSKSVILKTLDLIEINKMNVFHWHMTDNQAFPYQSVKFPMLRYVGDTSDVQDCHRFTSDAVKRERTVRLIMFTHHPWSRR